MVLPLKRHKHPKEMRAFWIGFVIQLIAGSSRHSLPAGRLVPCSRNRAKPAEESAVIPKQGYRRKRMPSSASNSSHLFPVRYAPIFINIIYIYNSVYIISYTYSLIICPNKGLSAPCWGRGIHTRKAAVLLHPRLLK